MAKFQLVEDFGTLSKKGDITEVNDFYIPMMKARGHIQIQDETVLEEKKEPAIIKNKAIQRTSRNKRK